jgi:hypothetical protein
MRIKERDDVLEQADPFNVGLQPGPPHGRQRDPASWVTVSVTPFRKASARAPVIMAGKSTFPSIFRPSTVLGWQVWKTGDRAEASP